VATDGANGAIGWAAGRVVEVEAEPVRAVDTTGAGDAFRAGLAAAWLGAAGTSLDVPEMLRFASKVAALNCRDYGAQTALPTRVEAGLSSEGRV
jgi:sugar/nucleoside kinase (ribokinase family)